MFNICKKIQVGLAAICILMCGCSKDFLENTPKGFKLAVNTVDYNNLLEDETLSSMDDYTAGSSAFKPAPGMGLSGDDVAVLYPAMLPFEAFYGSSVIGSRAMFSWSADVWPEQSNSPELLGGFNKIYIANKIINEVLESQNGSEDQKRQYWAEGLANRAFNYFYLLNIFTKPYNAGTAATDLGLPIILEANATGNNYVRETLQATYDLVIKDLTDAIPHLPLTQTNASRFTKAAAEALLGKVYLFMRKFDDAEAMLDAALSHLPSSFIINGNLNLLNYNTAEENPFPVGAYVFNEPGMTGSSQDHPYPESLLSRRVFTLMVGGMFFSGIVVTPEVMALFGENDKRRSLYSSMWGVADGQFGEIPFGLKRVNAGNLGYSVGIQLPDVYLLHAEAKARNGAIEAARESLMLLRRSRMPDADAQAVPMMQDELVKFIVDERRREFCGFGTFRWDDMRRLFNDPLFAGTSYKHYKYDATEGLLDTYTLTEQALTLKFPKIVLVQNPGLQQNP